MALDYKDEAAEMELYLESLLLIERLHRRFLDVLKSELERLGRTDVNSVQSLILYNIGDEDLTIGELTNRGYDLGSNVSYNVKKLVENEYLLQERSVHDRRSVRVRLSPKGQELRQRVHALFERHAGSLQRGAGLGAAQIAEMNGALKSLERYWDDHLRFRG